MPCVFGRFINAVKIRLFLSLKIGADESPLLFRHMAGIITGVLVVINTISF